MKPDSLFEHPVRASKHPGSSFAKPMNARPWRAIQTALALVLAVVTTSCPAGEFQVSLNSGTVITVTAANQSFVWTDVLGDGQMKQREIDLRK